MKTASQWLDDDRAFVTSILALLTDKYGLDFLEWDPITITMEIKSDYGLQPDDFLMDKIGCGSALLTSNLFFKSLESFNASCNVLNRGLGVSETFMPADLEDVLWGVAEAKVILDHMFDEEEFSHDIALFVGKLLSDRGVYEPPALLSFAEFDEFEVKNVADIAAAPGGVATDMLQAHFDSAQESRDGLNGYVNDLVDALTGQLKELPLKAPLKIGG